MSTSQCPGAAKSSPAGPLVAQESGCPFLKSGSLVLTRQGAAAGKQKTVESLSLWALG